MRGVQSFLFISWMLGLVIMGPGIVSAEADKETAQWAKHALRIQQDIEKGGERGYLAARKRTKALAEDFSQGNFSHSTISVAGIQVLSQCLINMDRELNRLTPRPQQAVRAAKRLALAFDALAYQYQPLWHQYKGILQEDVTGIQNSITSSATTPYETRQATERLFHHIELINPALILTRQPETVEKIHSMQVFLQKEVDKEHLDQQRIEGALSHWHGMIATLFPSPEKKSVVFGLSPSGILVPMLVLGSVILGVLGYVGWRQSFYHRRLQHRKRKGSMFD